MYIPHFSGKLFAALLFSELDQRFLGEARPLCRLGLFRLATYRYPKTMAVGKIAKNRRGAAAPLRQSHSTQPRLQLILCFLMIDSNSGPVLRR